MSRKLRLIACVTGVVVPCLFALEERARRRDFYSHGYHLVPGGINSFDIGFVDADIHTYAVADRTNATVDIIDTNTNKLVKQLTAILLLQGVRTTLERPPVRMASSLSTTRSGGMLPNCNRSGRSRQYRQGYRYCDREHSCGWIRAGNAEPTSLRRRRARGGV